MKLKVLHFDSST